MATALSVFKKALWLGQRGKTTTLAEVAPASYELEVHANTCEKYPVVLRAVYTVDPKKENKKLLLQASKPKVGCPSHVKELVEHNVRVLAAGMTVEQMLIVNGGSNLVKEALGRVNLDLAKSKSGGLLVYCARIERFDVHVPSNRPSMEGFTAQRTMAAAVAVVDPATNRAYRNKQMKVAAAAGVVETQVRMEVQGQNKRIMAGFTQRTSVQVDVKASVAVAVAVVDPAPATTMIKVTSSVVRTQVQMQLTAY